MKMSNKCGDIPSFDLYSSEWNWAMNVAVFLVVTNIVIMNNKCGAFPICDSHSSEWKLAINVVVFLAVTNIVLNENEQ
jgi:hypothetical protein